MSYEMNELLELVVEQNASDLHLQVGQPPTLRLSGSMTPIDGPALTPIDTEKLMQSITPDSHISNVKLNGGSDFGFAFGEKARFRVSVLKQAKWRELSRAAGDSMACPPYLTTIVLPRNFWM